MIFQVSKSIVLTVCALVMMLTACTQPPNYAPIKTVNQAVEPDNGYVTNRSPIKIKPSNNLDRPQQSAKTIHEGQEYNPIRQNPIPNRAPYPEPHQHRPSQIHSTGQVLKKEAASATITSNKNIADQNQWIQKPITLPYKIGSPPKNKPTNPAVDSNPTSKPQKSLSPNRQPIDQSKNKAITSNTNNINTHKNQKNSAKSMDNLQLTQKNNKEKTSIISIDNKKVLKLKFQWPLRGKISRNFTQTDNKGIDITGKTGQSVHAAEAGKAVYCGQGLAGFGNLAIIEHDETYLSAYANNSWLYIKEGQHVEKGQTIGQVSAAGLKKASLHFEIRKNGKSINPLTLLPKH
jgi:murein DD-endopeptidase MepM/ murein hydrolase activator NlpD